MQREDRANQAGEGRERGDRPRGFTLIELLVVILILGILVGLVVGVGRSVMIEMNRRRTMVIQDIILAAVRAFHEVREAYPAQMPEANLPSASTVSADRTSGAFSGSNYGYITWFPGFTNDLQRDNVCARIRNAYLYQQLAAEPASAKVLQKLPPEAVFTITQSGGLYGWGPGKVFRDGFDFDMDYLVTALGPVIISTGPDGYFSRDSVRDYDLDNIRSDGRGR